MIDGLTLEGFQSHEDSFLDFDPGVNVIVGSSDAGKSSIVRALHWNINNAPSGDSFINNKIGDSARCVIQIGDLFIERFKSKSQNEYVVFEEDEEGETYKAMGKANVPENVEEIYNMSFVNWQHQMDPPFLISLTGGKISQKLNEVINLSVMDSSLLTAKQNIKTQNQSIQITEALVDDCKTQLEDYVDLDAYEKELEKLEALAEQLGDEEEAHDELLELVDNLEALEIKMKELPLIDYKQFEKDYQDFMDEPGTEDMWESMQELQKLVNRFQSTYDEIEDIKFEIKDMEEEFKTNMPEECPLCEQPIS